MNFGEITKVPLRDIWPHEALNFTPWLANHLDKLGEALGIDLELTDREANVGDFSLDILAKDLSTTHTVIIENQLTQTDHDHLGKLITYAAGFDAAVIIWIAESFREEHRQALDWLNQKTDSDTLFFAVSVEVIKIDESKPAYTFKLVASPNEWQKSKKNRIQQASISEKEERYQIYFQKLIDDLRNIYQFTSAKVGQPQNWYSFSSGIKGIYYGANFTATGKARAEIYIDVAESDTNESILQSLIDTKDVYVQEFHEDIHWEKLDGKRACRVALYKDGSIMDSEEELEEIRKWHIEKLLELKRKFGSNLALIVKDHISNLKKV
jgi:hypothetical protein